MRAIILENKAYRLEQCPRPAPSGGEVLIKVAYAGVNRADLFQLQGKYPLPERVPAIPGMEVAGEIIALGEGVSGWNVGDRVCALMTEGGYGEYAVADARLALPVPDALTLEEAAALPEACFTYVNSLVRQTEVKAGETLLIHGGASGIGLTLIPLACALGIIVYATAGTEEKCTACREAGAIFAVNYQVEDFVAAMKRETGGKGVDAILDMVGGDYFARNLDALAEGGRLSIIAFLKGPKVEASLAPLLLKRLTVTGATLRSLPVEMKARMAEYLRGNVWKFVEKGRIKPRISRIFPLELAEKSLYHMEQGLNVGKIVINMQA